VRWRDFVSGRLFTYGFSGKVLIITKRAIICNGVRCPLANLPKLGLDLVMMRTLLRKRTSSGDTIPNFSELGMVSPEPQPVRINRQPDPSPGLPHGSVYHPPQSRSKRVPAESSIPVRPAVGAVSFSERGWRHIVGPSGLTRRASRANAEGVGLAPTSVIGRCPQRGERSDPSWGEFQTHQSQPYPRAAIMRKA